MYSEIFQTPIIFVAPLNFILCYHKQSIHIYICLIKYDIFCDYSYIIRKGIEVAGRSRQLRKTISVTWKFASFMYNYSPWTRLSYIGKNIHDNNKFRALIWIIKFRLTWFITSQRLVTRFRNCKMCANLYNMEKDIVLIHQNLRSIAELWYLVSQILYRK